MQRQEGHQLKADPRQHGERQPLLLTLHCVVVVVCVEDDVGVAPVLQVVDAPPSPGVHR